MTARIDKVTAMAALVADQVSVEENSIIVGSEVYYASAEAEGLDRKTVDKVGEFNTNFIAATGLVVGQLGAEILRQDVDADKITGSFGTSTGTVEHSFFREFKTGEEVLPAYLVSSVETSLVGQDDVIRLVIEQVAGLDLSAAEE